MKKVFKKSLSCLLAAILCISLFVAAVPASAVAPTYSTNAIEAKAGDPVNIDFAVSNFINVQGALIRFNLPSAIGSVESVKLNGEDFEAYNPDTGKGYYQIGQEDGVYYVKFLSLFGAELGELDSMETLTFNIAAKVKADAAAQVYEYPEPVFSVTEDGETLVDVTGTFGTFEVVEDAPVGPVVDSNLVFAGAAVAFGSSSLEINFRIRNTVLDLYDDMELVIIPEKYDTTTYNYVENPQEIVVKKSDLAVAGKQFKTYAYSDIMLYELALNIQYMLRAYDADGNIVAVSETFTTSPATYLKSSLAVSSDPEFITLATDALIVCEQARFPMAAQYPNSDLDNDSKITGLDGVDLDNATQDIGKYNTVNIFDSHDANWGNDASLTHTIRSSVAMEKVPVINLRIKDSAQVLDLSKLSLKVTYTSIGETEPFVGTYTNTDFTRSGSYITFAFTNVGLHDSNADITFEFSYYGKKVCDWTYSVETYLGANQSSPSVGDLAVALIKLGKSFRTYKGL